MRGKRLRFYYLLFIRVLTLCYLIKYIALVNHGRDASGAPLPVCGASRSSRNNLAYTPSADRRQASENTEVAISNRCAGRDIRARLRLRAHRGARRRATAARHGARSRASARRARAASPASASGGGSGRARSAGRHRGRVADSRRAASPRYPSGGRQIHRPKRSHQYGGKPG